MKSFCLKDHNTGTVFKILLSEEELDEYLKDHPEFDRLADCKEYDDSPSLLIED
jgi:hypothetical protein